MESILLSIIIFLILDYADNFFIFSSQQKLMTGATISRQLFTFVLVSIVAFFWFTNANPCPFQQQTESIVSSKIQVNAQDGGIISLKTNKDSQTFNYTLQNAFNSVPSVAISISDFGVQKISNQIYLAVKHLQYHSKTIIPFLVRVFWKHTTWNKIAFIFLAEDRIDIEGSYRQIDSSNLGASHNNKQIQTEISFNELRFFGQQKKSPYESVQHKLFLSGFEITTNRDYNGDFSPYEIQIVDSQSDFTGIKVKIAVDSQTEVHAIHLSYLAWFASSAGFDKIISGSYSYFQSAVSPTQIYQHTPDQQILTNYARIYGLTGFKIENENQILSLATQWTGNRFIFDFGSSNNYRLNSFSFQYVFFSGSECSSCAGYPYSFNGKCYASCPLGTSATPLNVCISCGDNKIWDGSNCIKKCPQGQFLNKTSNECVCPPGLFWTGDKCIICTQGRVFNQFSRTCQCRSNQRWNGYSCVEGIRCQNGKQWDIFSYQCRCPDVTTWNGSFCIRRIPCNGGRIINSFNQCVCPEGTYSQNGWCEKIGCIGGQIWNGRQCTCQSGYHFNGSFCLLCINGQTWNELAKQCVCGPNTRWNGQFCEKYVQCSNGRVYREDIQKCICPEGSFWNGIACMKQISCCCGQQWNEKTFECQCPSNFKFDGQRCVLCMNGKYWNAASRVCQCPPGSQWDGQMCFITQSCSGGMQWNKNTRSCQCPSTTVWNGNYCLANPCSGGQVWDNALKRCICLAGKVLISGVCRPGEQSCSNGKKWSPEKYACICSANQWDNGAQCENIPSCVSNQKYNPLNNKCECPSGLVWLQSKLICGDTTCPIGTLWDGQGCKQISCPPQSYYNGSTCISGGAIPNCQPWEYYDGEKCVYSQDTCPQGTRWNGNSCVSTTNCPTGYYLENSICKPFSQQCNPPATWNGKSCVTNGTCPIGTYYSQGTCKPQNSCSKGQFWNSEHLQCLCPQGTGWNGNQCVMCGNGQVWDVVEGCICPEGHFFVGSSCERPDQTRCLSVPNGYWDFGKNMCLCGSGFSVVGYQCICRGVPLNNFCDRCAHRPNSEWTNKQCQCKKGYTLYGNECLPNLSGGSDNQIDCSIGTFFDNQQKRCLACSDGCLSCLNTYQCKSCNPSFKMNFDNKQCIQNCGDGKKFVSQCDDGNNQDGDGCSRDCKVQIGYTCRGGSPNTPDNCVYYNPSYVTLTQTGQIRYPTKLVVNIKADYLPKDLIASQECYSQCSQILVANVLPQGTPFTSVHAEYITGTSYSFTVEIEFGRSFMDSFTLQVSINPKLKNQYFSNMDISKKLRVDIQPGFLSLIGERKNDNLR